jgi:hypothetical protein
MTPRFVGAYCLKQRRLAKIWRAIARRRTMLLYVTCHELRMRAAFPDATHGWPLYDSDGETDP